MKCPKCDGKGFTEYEAGLILVVCEECKGSGEVGESIETIEKAVEVAVNLSGDIVAVGDSKPMLVSASGGIPEGMVIPEGETTTNQEGKSYVSIDSGTGQPDKPVGSPDTSKPVKRKKPKARKKSGKGTHKILQKA